MDEIKETSRKKRNWFKQHADTVAILGAFVICFWTLNEKMNDKFNIVDSRFNKIETDLAVIKTVLTLKNIMPTELAKCDKKEEKNG